MFPSSPSHTHIHSQMCSIYALPWHEGAHLLLLISCQVGTHIHYLCSINVDLPLLISRQIATLTKYNLQSWHIDIIAYKTSLSSMPHAVKSAWDAAILSSCWLVNNIWPRASYQFEHLHSSLTALMCFDSVIEEHKPLGAPNSWIIWA